MMRTVDAEDVEARVEQPPALALTNDGATPGRRPFAGRIDAAVAGIHTSPVAACERDAATVDADPLDRGRVRRDRLAADPGETTPLVRTPAHPGGCHDPGP